MLLLYFISEVLLAIYVDLILSHVFCNCTPFSSVSHTHHLRPLSFFLAPHLRTVLASTARTSSKRPTPLSHPSPASHLKSNSLSPPATNIATPHPKPVHPSSSNRTKSPSLRRVVWSAFAIGTPSPVPPQTGLALLCMYERSASPAKDRCVGDL